MLSGEAAVKITAEIAKKELRLQGGDKIIITGGDTSGTSGNTSLIKVENI